jgi:uncharacterized protein YyaL (SSP411 family)
MTAATPGSPEKRPNRLASESSPYLLQHRFNPVEWYPWGDEAFEAARKSDRPVFLSIGYSTCHWCHVMERESFENEEVAALMNRDFVSIKVDREERPDLDNVYMTACQLMTQSGGWPLTLILTPDGRPFFAGTYYPPEDRQGRMGMRSLLPRIAEVWKSRRAEVEEQATHVAEAVRQALEKPPASDAASLDDAFGDALEAELEGRFDREHGGFGGAPKFPPHGPLRFLLFRTRRGGDAAAGRPLRTTLDAMQDGGIFDQVGGGFHRYSVDGEWFLPHFEKMLYDNAQLLEVYAGAARSFGDNRYRETAERIAEWLERDMKTPEGAFASALDADSEGEEGKYYLWTSAEIQSVLGKEDFEIYREAFDIRESGNAPAQFEEGRGKNLPRAALSRAELARRRRLTVRELSDILRRSNARLEAVRRRRVPPGRDDKVITAWNALAVSALCRASRDLEDPRLLGPARRAADFLLSVHARGDEVLHVSRGGRAKIGGFLEDYALLSRALLDLAEVTGEKSYAARARQILRSMVARFADERAGGFYQTSAHGPRGLLDSAKEFLDQVIPSPNGAAVEALRRASSLEPDPAFDRAADLALRAAAPYASAFPTAAASFAILASGAPGAPPPPASRRKGPVTVTASLSPGRIVPGGKATLLVTLEIDRGWHVQSSRPSRSELSATEVLVTPPPGLRAERPAYPPGREAEVGGDRLSLYTGRVEIPVVLRAPSDAAKSESLVRARVVFQPCDDSRCLAPERVEVAVPVRIEGRE